MPVLPAHPNLDQLRHQARDLLRAARSGTVEAAARIAAVSQRRTLSAAQLAFAREYGFASWAKLRTEVDARMADLAAKADAFCQASIGDWTGRAARMLAATPEIATYSFATALVLGDVARVQRELAADQGLAIRPDSHWGWTPLHAVCASRWHRWDPARADGLLAIAQLLLDAGADATAATSATRAGANSWTPLRCAVAGAANPTIVRLLLHAGAVPNDHDLYLAEFGGDDHQSLRLLLDFLPNIADTVRQALAAPISLNDLEGVRMLLEAGVDPRHYVDDDGQPCSAISAAVKAECSTELVQLLLQHGADPNSSDPHDRSPYQLAIRQGRGEMAELLSRFGAPADATDVDQFLAACLQAGRASAERQLSHHPDILDRLSDDDRAALTRAAAMGNAAAVRLMLDLGFPLQARGEDGGSALHHAAYAGGVDAVRLLLERGADIDARDTTWDSPALVWALVGSGERPRRNPNPDWLATVRTLIEAGASTQGITVSPDDAKQPSHEVAEFLRGRRIGAAPTSTW